MGFLFSSYRISIHAPTRGATKDNSVKIFAIVFQSTLPRGERRRQQCRDCCLPEFQSTLPRGERRFFRRWRSSGAHFNPRSHEGSDDIGLCSNSCSIYFNPRSHEGSDFDALRTAEKINISIHAPTRGATQPHSKQRNVP